MVRERKRKRKQNEINDRREKEKTKQTGRGARSILQGVHVDSKELLCGEDRREQKQKQTKKKEERNQRQQMVSCSLALPIYTAKVFLK